MKNDLFRLISILALLALVATPASAMVSDGSGKFYAKSGNDFGVSGELEEQALYIVLLKDPSVASYAGGIDGFAPTSPAVTGSRKLDIHAPETIAFYEYLESEQNSIIYSIEQHLGRTVNVSFQYIYVLNGFAVELTEREALSIRSIPGIVDVQRDVERELDTDISPTWIGATDVWSGDNGQGLPTKGEGIVIGVLDTGINHDHPSFAEVGEDGYVHINPYGSGNYAPGSYCDVTDPTFCNDKLIGAWAFHSGSSDPEDWDGHGSHTASTAGGNTHDAVFMVGTDTYTRTISGIAPHANIIAYQVCYPSCPGTSSVAAVNQAIADGADVLNYSISGQDNPWNDPVDLAFLDAFNAGIFVSASAGNDGPGEGTVAKTGGWNASVGATTHNRVIANTLDVTAPVPVPPELTGLAAVAGTGPAIVADIENDILWAGDVLPGNETGCSAFPANAFNNAIALIQRGGCTFATKVNNADGAGAIAVVVFNNIGGPPIFMSGLESTSIPAVFLDLNDGSAVRDWIIANPGAAVARINTQTSLIFNNAWGDILAGFSSRGPSQYNVIKPDYTAPGVNILAADVTTNPSDPPEYGFKGGTSMSSPHGAGSAALMMSLHPNWSPVMVKSAMALTAFDTSILKEDEATPADPFDMGGGRLDLAAAGYAGFTLDETYANFVAANPAIGGDPKTLNLPGLQNNDCSGVCSWTRVISSTLDVDMVWDVVVSSPPSLTINVSPPNFTLGAGMTETIQIEASGPGAKIGEWIFGKVVFTPTVPTNVPPEHFPVAVNFSGLPPAIEIDPNSLSTTQVIGEIITEPLTITNIGDLDLEWSIYETDWFDNFDSYAPGSQMHGQGGWKGWDNNPAYGALVSSAQGHSLPNSVEIVGNSDLVHEYTGYQAGVWTYTAWQYIPAGYTGQTYFIMLNTYADGGPNNWSTQVCFNSATGQVYDDVSASCSSASSLPIVYDEWIEIRVEIDLTSDIQTFYYNDQMLYQDSWTGHVSGSGALNIGAVDLFANGASPVYYDDISIFGTCGNPGEIPWLSATPDNGITPAGLSTVVDVAFDATNMVEGIYPATLCVASNDPVNAVVQVPVTMTVEAPIYGIEFVPDSFSYPGDPGFYAQYMIALTNTGNTVDTFDITYMGNNWVVEVPEASFTLPSGEAAGVTVQVWVPEDALAGESDTVTVTATSQGDNTVTESVELTTVAAEVFDGILSPDSLALTGAPGSTVEYMLTLSNTSNITATFDIEYAGNDPAWMIEIPQTHYENLGVGESFNVLVRVMIPGDASDMDSDSVDITIRSADDGMVKDTSTLTTTALIEGYIIYLPTISK